MASGRSARGLPVHAHPGRLAGLHRGSGGRGLGLHARRDSGAGRRPPADQPAGPGGPGHRPLGAGGLLRHRPRLREERGPRVRAEPRALRPAPLGAGSLRELPRGSAGHGDRPPGQLGVLGVRDAPQGARRRHAGVSRHRGRHRFPHHDDQRTGRGGLGRGRHRGGGRPAGPAVPHAAAGRGGREVHGRAPRGRHGDGPGPARHRDAAGARRGRPFRGVLRRGAVRAEPAGQGHAGQHVARVRRDRGVFPRGRRGPSLLGRDRPRPRPRRARGARRQGAGTVPRGRRARPRVHVRSGAGPVHHRAQRGRTQAAPGPDRADRHSASVPP